eukprot:4680499-Pleurochrysis_carterae.AAC.1
MMNAVVADMLAASAGRGSRAPHLGVEAPMDVDGGRVADGPHLSAYIRARIAGARATPPAF